MNLVLLIDDRKLKNPNFSFMESSMVYHGPIQVYTLFILILP